MRACFRAALAALGIALAAGPASGQDLRLLEAEVRRLATVEGADVGVGIRHLESGAEVYVNGDRAYLMGSTFKIPVAVHLLALVDAGEERLDRQVALRAADLFPSGSLLSDRFRDEADPGVSIALERYLELMLILSDNAATDVILREVGGTTAVMERVRSLGIRDLRVDRTTLEVYYDYTGVPMPDRVEDRTVARFIAAMSRRTPAELAAAQEAYHADPRDRATPRAMTELLARIGAGEALSPGSTELLLAIMDREEHGVRQIAGRLPPGTRAMNKTGRYGDVVLNDVGFVDLPGGAGRLAIAVFTESEALDTEAQRRIAADVARAAYDFFVFAAPGAR